MWVYEVRDWVYVPNSFYAEAKKGRKKLSIMTSIVTETSGLYPSVQAEVVHRYISDVEQFQKLSRNEGNLIVTCTWGTNSQWNLLIFPAAGQLSFRG